jgi:3-dehydroquinate synthetase/shikimate kinase
MGAGKTTAGRELAARLGRPFVDVDEAIEAHEDATIPALFERHGEPGFRLLEERATGEALAAGEPAVLALGGGALGAGATRDALRARAFTILLEIDSAEAWERAQGGDRPLARDRESFDALYASRLPAYEEAADGRARDVDGAILEAAGVHVQVGALSLLDALVPGDGPVELVVDANVNGIHGVDAQLVLGARGAATHEVPAGEAAKALAVLERLLRALRVGRDGTLVALGGGATTDLGGLAAALYLRGIGWVAVPTTLVGQVDAAIGGKTAIDLPEGKNLVGAFHWPARVVVDAALLETLPDAELTNGRAEVVKTGLLAGDRVWERPLHEQVRACAAFKAAVCLRDPGDRGPRNQLNLGHTFAHALEAAAGYRLPHGRAVALGLVAALRLSVDHLGLDPETAAEVEHVLRPQRLTVDREAAWAALARDKKAERGTPRLVLLEAPGRPRWGVELPEKDVRAALDGLIA